MKNSHNTKVTKSGTCTIVRYHKTDIVQFSANVIVLQNGGWFTPTTKKKMNRASQEFNLGFFVFQRDFTWYVTFQCRDMEYYNGMVLNRRGE
jgi:hypothetical protein